MNHKLPRIKIKLPIEEKLLIDERLTSRGYLTFGEYVRDLIRRDLAQERYEAFKTSLLRAKKQARATSDPSKVAI